jgi:hypothetical protein
MRMLRSLALALLLALRSGAFVTGPGRGECGGDFVELGRGRDCVVE